MQEKYRTELYIKRHAEQTVEKLAKMFGAILVAGPRQVGKTTMLQNIARDLTYVTLDDLIIIRTHRFCYIARLFTA